MTKARLNKAIMFALVFAATGVFVFANTALYYVGLTAAIIFAAAGAMFVL